MENMVAYEQIASPCACGSRMTSRDFPEWRAYSQAKNPLRIGENRLLKTQYHQTYSTQAWESIITELKQQRF